MKMDLKWQAFCIVSIGIFISTLDGSILNIANPSIAHDIQVNMEEVQWVVTAYLLVITSSLIFFGRLGDKVGSNKVYTYGFLVFTLGSLGCSLSRSLLILIAARIFQGLGASMMMATGIGIISNIFPSGERGKALGLTGTVVAMGNMMGPSLGGILLAKFQWPVIFMINVPIGLLGFYLGYKYLPSQDLNHKINNYDIRGIVLMALAVTTLIISLSNGQGINIGLLLASVTLMILFYVWEKKAVYPLLDFDLFKVKTFIYGNFMAVAVYFTQTSVFFLLPFYMETILQISPAHSGLLMTITPVSMALVAPLSGYLSDKVGSERIICLSFLFLTASFLVLASLNTNMPIIKMCGGLFLLGIGMGMFGSPNTSSILGAIPRDKAGYGGGFISTNRNLSYSLGIASSVGIFTWLLHKKQTTLIYSLAYIEASQTVYLAAASISLGALLLCLLALLRKKPAANAE
ncbi:MAG: MFS transporter [Firmicutes bacterium HGW-Firmicutes-15]|nr:MAG: MFS transporter [Firmicutes bacterium HGW-Firmicutes-15]